MAAEAQRVIDEYTQGGWEVAYTDGSSESHPQAGMVGGYGVYFGDHRDMAAPLPTTERQTNNRGELRAALHAIRSQDPAQKTLICSDSQLVVMGVTSKASKWQRHDWQGSRGPVGHVDLWEHLLQEIERAGPAVRWLHVPSHVGIQGNTKADTLADMGRRRSPLLEGLVTAVRRENPASHNEPDDVSDLEEAPLWSPEEKGGGEGGTAYPPPPPSRTATKPQGRGYDSPPAILDVLTPPLQHRTGAVPLVDVEDCTPASKRPRVSASGGTPATRWRSRAQSRSPQEQGPLCGTRQELFADSFSPLLRRGT